MKGHEILPYAAPVIFSAMVAITSWLSYRRIMKKYPTVRAAGVQARGIEKPA
jgi:hypothetical protein